jgi:hypothetical protein
MLLKRLNAWLNESSLPRAIADFERQRFVSWNARFLQRTGYSEDRIKVIRPEEIVVLGDVRFPLPGGSDHPSAEFVTCAIRTTLQPAAVPGHIVKSLGRLSYIMLEGTESSTSADFDEGRLVGQEEERARIVQRFHDEVSSPMIAALFAIESAKNELETRKLPQVETVAKASELLTEAVEKLVEVLEGKKVAEEQSPLSKDP